MHVTLSIKGREHSSSSAEFCTEKDCKDLTHLPTSHQNLKVINTEQFSYLFFFFRDTDGFISDSVELYLSSVLLENDGG